MVISCQLKTKNGQKMPSELFDNEDETRGLLCTKQLRNNVEERKTIQRQQLEWEH